MTARLPRPLAVALALLLAGLIAWAMIVPPVPVPMDAAKPAASYNDINLYADVAAAVAQGKGYYQSVAELHRAHGYPLQPFLVVRLPTMAYAAALLGWPALRAIAMLLLIGGGLVWFAALRSLHTRAEQLAALIFAVVLGGGAVAAQNLIYLHECWVGLLLFPALPLLWRWPQRWPLALLLAAMALALRELALPFVLLAGAYALVRRDWRQAAAWGLLIALFAAGMALHRSQVLAVTRPGDIASFGWSALGGLSQLVSSVTLSSSLQLLPVPLARMAALLPLLGWLALRGPRALLVWLWFAGMALGIALFARPDNVYWGFVLMPAWMIGLALVPRLIVDLWRGLAGKGGKAEITGQG